MYLSGMENKTNSSDMSKSDFSQRFELQLDELAKLSLEEAQHTYNVCEGVMKWVYHTQWMPNMVFDHMIALKGNVPLAVKSYDGVFGDYHVWGKQLLDVQKKAAAIMETLRTLHGADIDFVEAMTYGERAHELGQGYPKDDDASK